MPDDLASTKRAAAAGANIIDVIAYPFITDLEAILKATPVRPGASTTSDSRSAA